MKRKGEFINTFSKKQKHEETIEDLVFCIKFGEYDNFDSVVKEINQHIDIINYAIFTDDDILLDVVVKKWSDFIEVFERNKIIYKKTIIDLGSEKCYMYFKQRLNQNFKPDMYYFPAFLSYIK